MNFDKIILGEGISFSSDCAVTGANNNIVVCGGTGCGKTFSITEPQLLETHTASVIATVTKRRIVELYAPLLKSRGYEVLDLNFIEPERSNIAYDPLQYVKTNADITFLAESIVMANPKKAGNMTADPYWDMAATSLLSAEIGCVLETEKKPTFDDVLRLHDRLVIDESFSSIKTTLDDIFKALAKENPNSFAVSCWKSFISLPGKTARCVYGVLNTTVDKLFPTELRRMIAKKKKIDFAKLATKRTVLFVSSSPVNTALNCFINMFYGQAFKRLFEYAEGQPGGRLPIPVRVICDDFATGCRIVGFPELISVFREKLISCTILLQSESQLAALYNPSDATTIINNCDTYVYMGGMDIHTAQSVSTRLNAPLEDILYMPIGQVIVFRRGQRPTVTQRYNITENEVYRQIIAEQEAQALQAAM